MKRDKINQKAFTQKIQKDLTEKVITLMENDNLMAEKWNMETFGLASGLHYNFESKHTFTGANQLLCMFSGFTDNRWVTVGKAFSKDNDYKVKKGSKVTYLLRGEPINYKEEVEENGKIVEKEKSFIKFIPVKYFNFEQIENAPEIEKVEQNENFNIIDRAEEFKSKMIKNGQDLRFHDIARYSYSPSQDCIKMLKPEGFKSEIDFYSTYCHETAHWTGHKTRLNRVLSQKQNEYALEELIAELFSVFQCAILGIEKEPRPDHARYLKSWIKALKDDYKHLWNASSKAFKIVKFCDELPS